MADLAQNIAALSPERRKLLERLLKKEGVDIAKALIVPQPRDDRPLPLSFAQQRLWFLDQFEPGSPFYNIPTAVRLSGRLDIAALERSLNEIVRRHETLRTTFKTVQNQPVQVIAPTLTLTVPLIDLCGLPAEQGEAEMQRLAAEEASRPFDLAQGPLLRATLIRLGDQEHVALLTMHHIISDGWSMGIFIGEVFTLYEAEVAGRPAALPDLKIQYADFAAWQRQWLQGGSGNGRVDPATDNHSASPLQVQLDYWQRQLGAGSPVLELPTDHPRPPVRSSCGAAQSHKLPPDLTETLTTLGAQEGATLFMTLLAAFQILLQRYSGQDEFAIGTPIANRTRAEIEPLIGFFVNTLVLRTDLTGQPSFRDVLRRARETALGAFAHQDLPFEMLVEAIHPERDMSRTPLFQVIFVLQNTPMRSRQLPGLTMRQIETTSGTARFDLSLSVVDQRDGLHITLGYSTDLFAAATITRMLGHLQKLLEGIVADPDRPIAQLPLLTETEQRHILVEWNATAAPYPQEQCFHTLFEIQVARTPDAVAVTFEGTDLTYAELNARANQLAHHLRALGVGPETLVGLCVERSLEMLVGLLGILKAGGAYVPLDPSYPAERIAFMLADAQPIALVTLAGSQVGKLAGWDLPTCQLANLSTCNLDTDWPAIAQQPTTNPDGGATAANLAYVMYTSGSTGQPKGVMIEHRSLVNYLCWANEQLLGDKVRHLPALTRLTFDASLKQLFAPLLRGDTVWMLPDDLALQPAALLQSISAQTQVGLNCVPSLWEAILSCIEAGEAPSPGERLTTLFVGGEQLRPELVERSLKLLPGLRIWNLYGPTEATANASANGSVAVSDLTIGRPIANTQLYILDPQLRPVPPGVPGELHIGGVGLARGYYKRPELTAEHFLTFPDVETFQRSNVSTFQRLYKTGDLVRYRPDGAIEFLGRIDQQVKLRGYRIELGEIEAALRQHPAVRDAVALVREDHPGDKRLAAYLVTHEEARATNAAESDADLGRQRVALIAELRVFLKGKLPDYMLPTNLVFLEALPQLPNGKIDRKALPAPDQAWSELREAYTAPRTPTEQILSAIWADVLRTTQVGLHDNFFELGGHSLMATQVIARIREAFQIELPLRRLFETPTVATLAEQVELARRDTSARQAPPITPVAQTGDLPLSFAQQRLWFLNQLEPESPSYNIPNAVRLSGELHVDVLERCINEIVRRHAILRTTFGMVDGRAVQVIAPEMQVMLALVDLRQFPAEQCEAESRRLADEEFRRPFDLARGPLLRATLLRLDDQEHIALFSMHHIVSDGWSGGVLVREVSSLYAAFIQQQASSLPDLPLQYVDFAAWQRRWLQETDECGQSPLQQQLDYWKRQMGDDQPVLQLPTDRPRPAIQTGNGAHMPFTITQHLTEGLYALSRREGATLFMTLLTAFQALLHRYSGQDDIRVGTPIANRTQAALESLIGCFINTLVLRANITPGQSFRQALAQARETALEAYANQDAPFEMVVEAVQPERDLSRTPLFQAMFILQNTPAKVLELPGLQLAPFTFDLNVSPFDLTLILEETPAGLHGAIEYSTDLFDAATITRFIEHFEMLLIGIVADPDRALAAIALLSDAERRRIMVEWNNTARSWETNTRISDRFEAQAARTPDAVAVKYEGSQISYAELNRRANQLAHYLGKHGVGPEVLVAINMERSIELIVAVLGVLKAGGAYLPLDPIYPHERLTAMLDDAQPAILLTVTGSQVGRLAGWDAQTCQPVNLPTCNLVTDWHLIAQEPASNPECGATGDNLAYVIYTSGSTGQPKGVMIEQRNLVNAYLAWEEAYQLRAAPRRHLQMASFTFDVFTGDLVRALCSGGTLVLCPRDRLLAPAQLYELLRQEQVDCAEFVPAVLRNLLQHLEQSGQRLDFMRLLICGSDSWYMGEYQRLQRVCGAQTRLINSFGLTETTIDSSYFEDGAPVATADQLVPIGRPFANTQLYILDAQQQPQPIGIPGELYIGGTGVARGYLNRPELTAERFLTLSNVPTFQRFNAGPEHSRRVPTFQRLYKTGDLARYRPDGNIEFRGRSDDQVKIRGFRIELGEVEAALARHPAVREAVAVVREDTPGVKRLVAYITAREAAPDTQQASLTSELRAFLKEKLPDYMLPAVFVKLAALPLLPNGKLNRRALPAPDQARPDLDTAFVAPESNAETMIADIWANLLGVKQVGRYDNFFELGGDSILGIQVIARTNQAGLRLTPRQLFQFPTVAGLAAVAGRGPAIQADQGLVTGPVPLSPIQHWFFAQSYPEPHHWNQTVLFSTNQPLDQAILSGAVARLLEHHDALRLRFTRDESGWRQVNVGLEAAPVIWIDLSAVPEAEQRAAIEARSAELQASLDLMAGPIMRVAYFDLGPACAGRLLFVVHHLAVDGVSWRILMEDLQVAYQQLAAAALSGQTPVVTLPPKTTSFQTWAQKLSAHAQSDAIQAELDYWRKATASGQAQLPRDFPVGINSEASARRVSVALTPEETGALLRDVPPVYRTEINDVLLTALAQAFQAWSGAPSLLIELEGHGREDLFDDVDVSRTVGWFTSAYPVRLDLTKAAGLGAALMAIKEQLRGIPQRGIGYGLLRYLSADPAISAQLRDQPRAEVSFNYLGQFDQTAEASSTFGPAAEARGPDRSPQGLRDCVLGINGSVIGGRLQMEWSYSANLHRQATVERLAQEFIAALRNLITHCQSPDAGGYTPSDFNLAKLDKRKLDKVLSKVKQPKGRKAQ